MENHRPRRINGKRVVSPEYRSWQAMRNRCNNPNASDWSYYGGRGIGIDPRWNSFDTFLADMGERPSKLHTLERRDSNAPYTPANCFWATRSEQARNRRFLKKYRGKFVWEIAAELGIKPESFHMRLWRFSRGEISEAQLYRGAK